MKKKYVLFTLFSLLIFGVSTSQTKYSFSGLGASSGGYKSITTSPTGANIVVSNTVTYESPIFYHSAPSENAFTITIKRIDYQAFNFYDMTWRNFGDPRTLAVGTKILFKRGDLADVTWTLSAAALDGDTTAKTIFNKSSAVTGVTQIIITADLDGFSNTSNNIEFKDITLALAPRVSTTAASSIDFTSVTLAGNATEEGDSEITERGIVYSRTAFNSNPIINGYAVVKNSNGIGTGVFSESITGLISNVNYSFRAYAINAVGASYGDLATFRTLDNIPPRFVSYWSTPKDDATGVATTANIVVDFDETITIGTGTITIRDLTSFANFEVFDIITATATSTPNEGALGILNDKLYINPTNELAQGNRYAIYIASTAINDTSNNSFAGINSPITFNFTTLDDTNPIFNSAGSTPTDNAIAIVTTANIVVDFDEIIVKGTGTITIRDVTGAANFEVFDIATATSTSSPAAGALGVLNDKLYINPTNALVESGNVYAIQIATTAIDDTFGNSFAGITDETTFNFTTANPSLGTYSDVTISSAGDNTTATPDAAPHQVVGITAYTDTNFKGEFSVNSLTGVIHITNAHPAGTYTITVNATIEGIQKTFSLTVGNTNCSNVLFASTATTELTAGTNPGSITIGDFNNDGIQDLATTNYNSFNVSINLGLSSGDFGTTSYISLGTIKPSSISIGDFNGDGNQDIATANYGKKNVSIRLGDGSGGFTGSTNVTVGNGPQSIAIGDFNNDGKQDFAVANQNYSNGGSVSIRLGDGLGGFTGSTNFSVGLDSKEVAIGDFNGDGNQDIAVSNPSSNYVSILIGNGAGVFSTGANVVLANGYQSIAIGDFNNDGSQDLAISSYSTNKVSIKLGNGAGLFSGSSEVTVGSGPWSLAIGDFNADGFQDITTANRISGTVSIRLGDGLGGFSGTTELTVASGSQSLTVGDFNGDGLQDIATANPDSNSVSIRLATVANINLQGNATTIASGDTTPATSDATDFGEVTINTPITKTYTIQNTGTTPLTISSIASSGTDETDFVVSNITLPAIIAPETNSTFTLTFNSTSLGLKTTTVTVNNDDCDEGTYTFAVKGSVETVLGIETNTIFNDVSIYPNPNTGLVNINLGTLKDVSINIYTIVGQLVYNEDHINKKVHQLELNTANGVYLIEIISSGRKQQFKLIKK